MINVRNILMAIVGFIGIALTVFIYNNNTEQSNILAAKWQNTPLVTPRDIPDWPEGQPLALHGIVINDGDWAAWNHEFEQCTTKWKKDSSGAMKTYRDCSWYSEDAYWGDIVVTDHDRKFQSNITNWDNRFYGAWDKVTYNDNGLLHRIHGIKVEQDIVAIGFKEDGKIAPDMVCFVNSNSPVEECLAQALGQKETNGWLIIFLGVVFTALCIGVASMVDL